MKRKTTLSHPAWTSTLIVLVTLGALLATTGVSGEETPPKSTIQKAQAVELEGVPNLYKVSESLYRSAQPSEKGMANLSRLGIKTVLSLRSLHSDRSKISRTGLAYERIPMTPVHPEYEDVVKFLKVVTDPKQTPVIVHCKHGADRTGTTVAIYRIVVQGWTKEEAINEMTEGGFGFHKIFAGLPVFVRELDVEKLKKDAGLAPSPPQNENK